MQRLNATTKAELRTVHKVGRSKRCDNVTPGPDKLFSNGKRRRTIKKYFFFVSPARSIRVSCENFRSISVSNVIGKGDLFYPPIVRLAKLRRDQIRSLIKAIDNDDPTIP